VRVAILLGCLGAGVIPLLLLNGQHFTNALAALPFFLLSTALCVRFAADCRTPVDQRRAWRLASMLLAIFTIAILIGLPSAYRRQATFKKIADTIHRARAAAFRP
jgi:hypothetical protein